MRDHVDYKRAIHACEYCGNVNRLFVTFVVDNTPYRLWACDICDGVDVRDEEDGA